MNALSAFVGRHKNKFLITAGIIGGIYYSVNLLKNKLLEVQTSYTQTSWSRQNIIERYGMNLSLSQRTIFALLSELEKNITSEMDIEKLFEELRSLSQKPIEKYNDSQIPYNDNESDYTPIRTKIEIWEEIKNQSFIRLMVSGYSITILSMLIHVQLSIIDQSAYADSVNSKFGLNVSNDFNKRYSLEKSLPGTLDEQNFLLLSWWFLNKGWLELKTKIETSVSEKIQSISIKSKISFDELRDIISSLNDSILSQHFLSDILKICLPTEESQYIDFLNANNLSAKEVETEKFSFFIKQAMDILESHEFEKILNLEIIKFNGIFLSNINEMFPVTQIPKRGIVELDEETMLQNSTQQPNADSTASKIELSINEFEQYLEVPDPAELCESKELQALSASIITAKLRD
ncbi:hypothetical protein BB561_005479 [Smittium simulii]|uniref:Peroxin-3 n=1 Tax=Smittium simulii TaxID=133385 RepID=A0A2T9YA78_9FUNG|nr:hypothetical protein BB561_005479 [Smittium simulii]